MIEVDKQKHTMSISDCLRGIHKSYSFDQVFDDCVCQHRFSEHICDPLIDFLKNQNGEAGLIFSYGITNSGKTHSILGSTEQPGILLTLIKNLE